MNRRTLAEHIDTIANVTFADIKPLYVAQSRNASLSDAIADVCIVDVERKGTPVTLAEWNARQIALASLVAVVYDRDTLDVLPIVAKVFPRVVPRLYARA